MSNTSRNAYSNSTFSNQKSLKSSLPLLSKAGQSVVTAINQSTIAVRVVKSNKIV